MLLAAPLFALEALRVSPAGELPPAAGSLVARAARATSARPRRGRALRRATLAFAIPILVAFAFVAGSNHARYGTLRARSIPATST